MSVSRRFRAARALLCPQSAFTGTIVSKSNQNDCYVTTHRPMSGASVHSFHPVPHGCVLRLNLCLPSGNVRLMCTKSVCCFFSRLPDIADLLFRDTTLLQSNEAADKMEDESGMTNGPGFSRSFTAKPDLISFFKFRYNER